MNAKPGSRAVVVGGGIGGLAAAVGLRRAGWDVLVLERSPELRELGLGVSLMSNATRCLDELGVGTRIRAMAATMAPGGEGVRTPRGRRLTPPADPDFVRANGLRASIVLRPQLLRVLAGALAPGAIRTGAEVVDVVTEGGRALVKYLRTAGAEEVPADLVVAADGVNSTVRRLLWPTAPAPVYSGHSVWRGITTGTFAEPGGNTWGRGRQFGRMPLADGRVYWYAVANTPCGAHEADEHAAVVRRFGSWHDPIPALLASTEAHTVLHHDVHEFPSPLRTFVRGNVVLLGDAAHAMTSDMGQGACQALEDAVVLSAMVAAEPELGAALAAYDRQRLPRTSMIIEASRNMGQLTLLERRSAVLARNLSVRRILPSEAQRRLAEVGGWIPPRLDPVVS
ncbi:FAD-dependent monooxygenase [Amycolatopsis sp. NPDC059021]|uniref:FAD-dependent monooxygenase n=1 Tax=Amycolatopsis sp. NPDC059021 TaxID=3346704 RepID=UPI0036703DC0